MNTGRSTYISNGQKSNALKFARTYSALGCQWRFEISTRTWQTYSYSFHSFFVFFVCWGGGILTVASFRRLLYFFSLDQPWNHGQIQSMNITQHSHVTTRHEMLNCVAWSIHCKVLCSAFQTHSLVFPQITR